MWMRMDTLNGKQYRMAKVETMRLLIKISIRFQKT